MFKTLKQIVIGAIMGTLIATMATGQTLLPDAKQQYLKPDMTPAAGGTVDYYAPGGNVRKNVFTDQSGTLSTNPVVLDALGRPQPTGQTYGSGSYRQVVKDADGNTIWDATTASTDSGGGGGGTATVGDGALVGSIKLWPGFTAPVQYVFAYGQALVRANFPALFAALTSQQNANCTLGNANLSGMSDTSQIRIGAPIESTCLNIGTTVAAIVNGTTITVSSNAIITTNTTVRVFPYGNGNGSTTFNVPDLRGRVPAGRDNMGGFAANRMPSVPFLGLGAGGGSATNTLITANLPPYTPSGSVGINDPGHVHGSIAARASVANSQAGGSFVDLWNGVAVGNTGGATTGISAFFTGNAQGGSSSPFSTVQPTQIFNWVIKTTPDSNANTFFGVASIGGMYGVIDCGFGITCAGNTISAVSSVVPAPTPTTLGGVFQQSAPANQFLTGVDGSGNLLSAQPAFSNISGLIAMSQGGCNANLTPSNGGILWSNATQCQILSGIANAGRPMLSGANATPSWAAFSLPGSVTSGGVAYFNSATSMSSSAVLTANAFMLGGGAGGAPTSVAITGLVLGNGASVPTAYGGATCTNQFVRALSAAGAATCNTVNLANDVTGILPTTSHPALTGDVTTPSGSVATTITNNAVTNAKIAQASAATLKGNPGASTANVSDFTIQGLVNSTTPSATLDFVPIYDSATGTIKRVTPALIASAGVAGVSSLNGKTGGVNWSVVRQTFCASGCTTTVAGGGSGTYTPTAGMVYAIAEARGGGGGGGGTIGNASNITCGAGGGSGGYSKAVFSAATIGVSKSVTIGAGGAGGSAGSLAAATSGGDTTLGTTLLVAKGGTGGTGGQAGVQAGLPGSGGVPGTGDMAEAGYVGSGGSSFIGTTVGIVSGSGGGPGGGQSGYNIGGTGVAAAANSGGGGGGACSVASATNFAGGAGASSWLFVTEYVIN